MARKPQARQSEVVKNSKYANDGLYRTAIFKIDNNGNINKDARGRFLLNPSSLQDDKSSNWVKHNVPGSSDPIQQWISGGPRTITLEALVTKDVGINTDSGDLASMLGGAVTNVVGSIASSFAGINIPPLGDALSLFNVNPGQGNDLAITNELEYYRELLKPQYTADGALSSSPPLVALFFGTSLGTQIAYDKITPSTPVFVVDDVKISITKFLPNLNPMEAIVTLTMTQYILTSQGTSSTGNGVDLSLGEILSIKPPF